MDVIGRKPDPRRIVPSVRGEKVAGGLVQVVPRAEKWITRALTDNEYFLTAAPAAVEKLQHPRKQAGLAHARTVGVALQLGPTLFLPDLPQVIAHGALRRADIVRYEPLLDGQLGKKSVIADDRVVKIDADNHVGSCFAP